MIENVIVGAVVGVVLILAGRSIHRTLTGKNDGCSCGTKSCAASERCHPATARNELKEKP